ncbi:RNA 2',3'-cyclic phosphodiesterase [Marinobacter salinisoli]|uniref:RNA 2',3'-cyclic phosphodiesterase n=1 Tax=Marinobacter salinisoli TaxID=2769486 RepID=A0ABX7MVS8_9GAMM|nr:RNA 2',3'-cyclic phosphodiesterase [Marinobacter salinisoli]QSP96388.1 RNA 2',3'-cyclic phosphodiesterase [Marinobacter salinisoli]
MPRLFFSIEIPVQIKQRLLQVRAPVAGARWQSAAQLHLTLLFLGPVSDDRVAEVCAEVRALAMPAFDLEVSGIGCFGQPASPRNLWAGVSPCDSLLALQAALKDVLGGLGFEFDQRAFRPHVTLARFKKQRGSVAALLDDHQSTNFGAFPVQEFVLYQSTQGGGGSVYTVLERFALEG